MEKICDFANDRTMIPPNLVRVIPDKTWNIFLNKHWQIFHCTYLGFFDAIHPSNMTNTSLVDPFTCSF